MFTDNHNFDVSLQAFFNHLFINNHLLTQSYIVTNIPINLCKIICFQETIPLK